VVVCVWLGGVVGGVAEGLGGGGGVDCMCSPRHPLTGNFAAYGWEHLYLFCEKRYIEGTKLIQSSCFLLVFFGNFSRAVKFVAALS